MNDFQETYEDFSVASSTETIKTKRISWEEFQKEYLTREDEWKYEWLGGTIEQTKRTMNYKQFFILRNLQRFFRALFKAKESLGELIPEGDMFFDDHHRRPDIAYLTDEQIDKTALGENQVPLFIIEIISTNDQINLFSKKMKDYRKASVQIVWEIRPEVAEILVYSGDDLKTVRVCRESDLCSAAPVLPDFVMSANDILKMPEKH